ncbi:MAG: hypothetical protein JXR05_16150 [Flavobacteriaceae bacterium]
MGILNNSIVGTILSMMLIYALLSILVSIILELWNQFKNTRAKSLKDAISTMIDGQEGSKYAEEFFNSYMVNGQIKGSKSKPIDHISDNLFTEAFTDTITKLTNNNLDDTEQKGDSTQEQNRLDVIKAGIEKISDNDPLKALLLSFCFKADGDYLKFESHMKDWYNEFMGRVSSWYKKAQRWKLLIAGSIIAISLNVDSIFLFNVINKNDTLRNELVSVADNVANDYSKLDSVQREDPNQLLKVTKSGINQIIDSTKAKEGVVDSKKLDLYIGKLQGIAGKLDSIEQKKYTQTKEALSLVSDLSIPIGWKDNRAPLSWRSSTSKNAKKSSPRSNTALKEYLDSRNKFSFANVLLYLAGIMITAFSLSFGAPFWFQMLSKLVNLRNIGKSSKS